jgi:hypothetical protein
LDIRELHWDDFFTGGRLTPMLYTYKPDGCYTNPFVRNPDKDSKNKIGMFLEVTDDDADELTKKHTEYGRMIYRPNIGELMISLYIVIEKSLLTDRRDHSYSINIGKGVSYIYEHFKERIEIEGAEGMKQQLCHIGGMLSGAVNVASTSSRKTFEFIDRVTSHVL